MEYVLTFHILYVYVDKTQPRQFKFTFKSVGVRKLQVAILAISPWEMSLTDRILPRYILSRVRVSVRPRIFLCAKNPKPESPACCVFQWIRSAASYTTELETAEPTHLGGVALRRRAINYDVSGCGVQGSEFKPHAGNNIFFHFYCLLLTRLTLNKS